LFEMTAEWAPFTGTVTADPKPSVGEVRRRVQQAVPGGPEWPPADLLPVDGS
jgi:hypothetical protein